MAEGGQNPAFSDDIEDSCSEDQFLEELSENSSPTKKLPSQKVYKEICGSTTTRDHDIWWDDAPKKLKGIYVKKFAEKINAFTWKKIKDVVAYDKAMFTDGLYCQMKTGIDLSNKEYIPLYGLSAQSKSNVGRLVTMAKCIREMQKSEARPCAIVGNAGSGKTVFMKRLAKQIIPANRHRQDEFWRRVLRIFRSGINAYDVTLYLNITDLENLDNVTLAQTIFNPSVTGLTAEEAQHGLQAILKKKIKGMMVFDGLDQTAWMPDADTRVGPWTKTTTASILGNILAGHLLPEVPIAMSLREHSVADLSQNMQPAFIASLSGFSEDDAKTMYTDIMGCGAEEQWKEIGMSSPALLSMCLTPMFLIYYVIIRKRDPTDPPDCTSNVMVRIVESLVISRDKHTSDEVVKVINKLKAMAFEGINDHRTIFTSKNLKEFEIEYCDVNKIKIVEPNILDQKIFQGTPRRFHFCHQALQDILAALHVAGMGSASFNELTDRELYKPHWSVVRSLTCGILNNERVLNKISDVILKRDELEKKRDYLMMDLETRLHSSASPAEKLDVFIALREARALHILKRHTEHLDFSDFPFTPVMMSVLCSELQLACDVRSLLLKNCSIDDELLEIFAKLTSSHEIKIGVLDLRGNVDWASKHPWRKIFENLCITTCMLEIPCIGQNEDNATLLLDVVKAAHRKVKILHLGDLKKIQFRIKEIEKIAKCEVKLQIDNIRLVIDERILDKDWKHIGAVARLFSDVPSWQLDYSYLPDLKFFAEGYGNVKFRRFTSWSSYQLYIRLCDPTTTFEDFQVDTKLMDVEFLHKHLPNQPFGVGQLIRECGFIELVFYWPYRELDVPAFASGLKGFQIKLLAVKGFSYTKILELVQRCIVERVYIDASPGHETLKHLESHTNVIILSEDEWRGRFQSIT